MALHLTNFNIEYQLNYGSISCENISLRNANFNSNQLFARLQSDTSGNVYFRRENERN